MTRKSFPAFFLVGVTGLTTLATLTASISPSFSQANSSDSPDKVTFFCREIFDEASGKNIPATVAWIPERQGNVRFIGWKSEYFTKSGLTPQKRCQKVTEKFQQLYSQSRLNYLAQGMNGGYHIICGLVNQGETCNGNNQLFTINPNSNSEQVLQRLMDITEGKALEGGVLQNSGGSTYIDVEKFLKQAPSIPEGN